MYWLLERSHVLILGGFAVVVALATILMRLGLRAMMGKDWPAPRVKVPWRFSILAVAVLTAIVACVLGLLRDEPDVAILAGGIVLLLWFPIARFQEFQQVLAERRRRALAAAVDARRGEGKDDK
jgi:high-affinity K+ transport system ATPase subunit B